MTANSDDRSRPGRTGDQHKAVKGVQAIGTRQVPRALRPAGLKGLEPGHDFVVVAELGPHLLRMDSLEVFKHTLETKHLIVRSRADQCP